MSELHPATRGFAAADVYERGRPSYPSAAVERIVEQLRLRPGTTVLDLAAGTGKLTRLDAEPALGEIHRVLKPGGGLALIWNARDERDPVQRALSELVGPLRGDTPSREARNWRSLLADSGLFERCERSLFEHEQLVDEQGLVERVLSISFVATASRAVRADAEQRVRALAQESAQPIRLSYMTELYVGFAV